MGGLLRPARDCLAVRAGPAQRLDPDFRLILNGGEAYAEVKPVSEFPMDVAQRVLGAGWTGDILILGREPRHAWRYRGD